MPIKALSAEAMNALETAPSMYLVLSPELYIITASNAFLQATETSRETIKGKHIFEAFPDNPDLPDGHDGVKNINTSLQKVLSTKRLDYMRVQRYDVPDINNPGKFITRYWDPSHTPVLDENGEISYIIQLANNVTDQILTERALLKSELEHLETIEQIKSLNEELLLSNNELRATQENLSSLNAQLEERVVQRTRELEQSERKIQQSYLDQQTLNEELAASNEEYEVTNEELAAANYELTDIQQRLVDTNIELETSSSRLQMAIESTQLGTWDYNPSTGELYWSRECREIYGIPLDLPATFELYAELIYADDKAWVKQKISDSLRPDKNVLYDLIYRINRYNNQEIRWIKVKGAVYFENEQPLRFIGTVLDITEMKLAQEESARLAAIIATSDDAIVSKTLESIITSWNGSAERMFGYTAEEMIGESIYKLIPADRYEEEPVILSRLKSGERVELKTPLTSLNALLQVADSKLKQVGDGFLSGIMQKSNIQVKRITDMINGFLNVSRLESAKTLIEKQKFELDKLVAEVIEETNLTVPKHNIHFAHCPPITVMADRDKISSVLSNLIGNAVKYSPNQTDITVRCMITGGKAVISIKDRGMGISAEDRKKIFDRYYRVKSDQSKHIAGFGIGLYLSAEIIHGHDGEIWVDSEGEKGNTFYFNLPIYHQVD